MKNVKKAGRAVWCHRAAYAALALAYGAGCVGILDKDTVALLATTIYCAMVTQPH